MYTNSKDQKSICLEIFKRARRCQRFLFLFEFSFEFVFEQRLDYGRGGSIESSSPSIWHAAYMLASKSDPRPFQTALIIQMLYFFISKLKFVRQSICEDLLKQQALEEIHGNTWKMTETKRRNSNI